MTPDDKQALKRILARLLGLADLAERASRRALPVRLFVLWILRFAEAHARNLVVGVASEFGYQVLLPSSADHLAPMILGSDGNRSTDALRLAVTFEMLAEILSDLIEQVSRQPRTLGAEGRRLFSAMKGAYAPLEGERRAACGTGWGDWRQRLHTAPSAFARAPPRTGTVFPTLT